MKRNKEDFYIAMLRFGMSKMDIGFRQPELVDHLQSEGYDVPSINSTLLYHYFPVTFFAKDQTGYPDPVSFYFLRPEAYFHLLDYDSMESARKTAKEARIFAIVSILLTLIATVVSKL